MQDGGFSNPFADADRVEQQKRKAEQQSQLAHAAPAQQQQRQGQAQITATSAPQLGFGQSAPASSATGVHTDCCYVVAPLCGALFAFAIVHAYELHH